MYKCCFLYLDYYSDDYWDYNSTYYYHSYDTSCSLYDFVCDDGGCIDGELECDGVNDCISDNSDEANCAGGVYFCCINIQKFSVKCILWYGIIHLTSFVPHSIRLMN